MEHAGLSPGLQYAYRRGSQPSFNETALSHVFLSCRINSLIIQWLRMRWKRPAPHQSHQPKVNAKHQQALVELSWKKLLNIGSNHHMHKECPLVNRTFNSGAILNMHLLGMCSDVLIFKHRHFCSKVHFSVCFHTGKTWAVDLRRKVISVHV